MEHLRFKTIKSYWIRAIQLLKRINCKYNVNSNMAADHWKSVERKKKECTEQEEEIMKPNLNHNNNNSNNHCYNKRITTTIAIQKIDLKKSVFSSLDNYRSITGRKNVMAWMSCTWFQWPKPEMEIMIPNYFIRTKNIFMKEMKMKIIINC